MNDINKARRISIILGIAFILAAALTIVIAAKTTHYTALITGITSTSRTHNKNGRSKYHERVSVTYKDNAGNEHTANNIHPELFTEPKKNKKEAPAIVVL